MSRKPRVDRSPEEKWQIVRRRNIRNASLAFVFDPKKQKGTD